MPRLFVAIDLPGDSKDRLLGLREDDLPPGRWSRREALHLTLHFIGDVPEAVARAYQGALAQVAAPAFDLQIQGVGQFPINDRPRVIWAGVQNTPALRALHGAVGEALEREGFRRERRRFHPHITLMRFRKPIRRGPASRWLNAHIDFYAEPFRVRGFTLYESDLQPSGAVYTKRAVYKLNRVDMM
ncbi:MAG: RNA 2',3'-cyclic phosphodiesterase [Chloroflexi bacterium]|nr:RNA 2',3'-cyclic phosphodiesterase [Chloroflexota bacterium]